jgi:hypothetical protein
MLFHYLDGFKGHSAAGQIEMIVGKTIRLPDNPCKFVMLSHWNTTEDPEPDIVIGGEDANSGYEIYYGFNGVLHAQLFATDSSPLLPVNNTNQICVRPRTATPFLYYAWFW